MADTIWMIDPTGATAGTLTWTRYTAVLRFNGVSRAEVSCPLTTTHMRAAVAGWRLLVVDANGATVIGGSVVKAAVSADSTGGRGALRMTLTIEDDARWIAGRAARPVPLASLSAQSLAHDVRTGVASTVIREYVDLNAGPGALTDRRVPGMVLAVDPVIGATVTGRARFDPVAEVISGLCVSGAVAGVPLGWRVVAGFGTAKTFEVYAPQDLRGPARFSLDLRNLKRMEWALTAPTATHLVAGGRGEDTSRMFVEVADTTAATNWGRVEDFYDYRSASDTDSGAELTQGASRRLTDQAEQSTVEVEPTDTGRLVYGRDYGLGAVVTVGVWGTITVDAVIREVEVTADRGGRRVRPRIGSVTATSAPRVVTTMRDLTARVSRLETRR